MRHLINGSVGFVSLALALSVVEKNHQLLFRASAEWLTEGTVNGSRAGMLQLGYQRPATGEPASYRPDA